MEYIAKMPKPSAIDPETYRKHVMSITLIGVLIAFVGGLVTWGVFGGLVSERTGQIGDSMGAWNALFSGAAFVFAGGALFLQSREMAEARKAQAEMAESASTDRLVARLSALLTLCEEVVSWKKIDPEEHNSDEFRNLATRHNANRESLTTMLQEQIGRLRIEIAAAGDQRLKDKINEQIELSKEALAYIETTEEKEKRSLDVIFAREDHWKPIATRPQSYPGEPNSHY